MAFASELQDYGGLKKARNITVAGLRVAKSTTFASNENSTKCRQVIAISSRHRHVSEVNEYYVPICVLSLSGLTCGTHHNLCPSPLKRNFVKKEAKREVALLFIVFMSSPSLSLR